jgi:hypothetical protein
MTDKPFPDLQAELRAGQRVYSVNDAPMACDGICICDPREPVEERRRTDWWPVVAVGIVCLGAILFAWAASAAERVTPGPHDLWLSVKPTAVNEPEASAQRNVFKIGADFEDHAACEKAKKGMRKVAGSLQCLPSN